MIGRRLPEAASTGKAWATAGAATTRAARARRGVLAALVAGIAVATLPQLVALVPVAAQTAPSRPVDTDINSYVLFGFDTVDFKGGNLTGRGIIAGGNVGANGLDPGAPDPTVSICANGRAVMSDGSQVVGATVRLARECVFWTSSPTGPSAKVARRCIRDQPPCRFRR